MRVILFGATGMVGTGVLQQCLSDTSVTAVLSIVRTPSGVEDAKLRELVQADFFDYTAIEAELSGYDACLFCLGVSAAGMSEAEYTRVTHDLTLRAAETLVRLNPDMTFCYVSGAGTDSSERGSSMWARVKGRTENQLLRLPFKAAVMFRPGLIEPAKGARSKTRLYRVTYALLSPAFPLLRAAFPGSVTTSEKLGRAMIRAGRGEATKKVLGPRDINALADAPVSAP